MALIAPVAFAAAGGLLTGGATWGMAAGWLIGSWLFNKNEDPKNQVFDPGAEEMPSFNQALRGATMPVLFGTNRVSSNIVWTNNFTTIRNESQSSGGGGKGGGSGLGMKGGQPSSGEVTYEYKWDIMFHIGMTDQNIELLGAWVGTENVNGNTIVSILGNSASQWATFTGLTGQDGLDLNFEDSYYHGGGATGDTIDPWSHFETVTGGPYRFPYTAYVGFKQLELGNTARVPQISWEVGEGGLNFNVDGATTQYSNEPNTSVARNISNDFIIARDGTTWHRASQDTFWCIENGNTVSFTTSTQNHLDLLEQYVYGEPPSTYNIGGYDSVINSKYCYITRSTLEPGSSPANPVVDCLLFEIIDGTGAFEVVGGFAFDAGGGTTANRFSNWTHVGWLGEVNDDAYLAGIGSKLDQAFDSEPNVIVWPSINYMKTFPKDFTTFWWTNRTLRLSTASAHIDQNFYEESAWNGGGVNVAGLRIDQYSSTAFMVLPTVTIGVLGLEWNSKLYLNVSRRVMDWHNDNPGSVYGSSYLYTLAATYPNGVLLEFEGVQFDCEAGTITYGTDTITEHANGSKWSAKPFDDEGVDEDGNLSDDHVYPGCVTLQPLLSGFGAGGVLVISAKRSNSQSDEILVGNRFFGKVRVALYNPLTEVFTQYIQAYGPICDQKTDWNQNDNRYAGVNYSTDGPGAFFNYVTNKLYFNIGDTSDQSGNADSNHIGQLGNLFISGGTDIEPPEIIYRILTSDVYGLGISPDNIDLSSYQEALLYCQSEGILVSTQYRREESALAIITQLLELYGGYLIDSGGKIKFGLQEFASSTVRTIDNHHLRVDQEGEPPVLITKGARQDTYNRVKVNYFDRNLYYRQNFVEVSDEVDMDINGVRAQEFPAKFVMGEATARKMAVRALWGNMYARDIYDFKLGAKDADLEPGDVITLVDSYHSELQSGKQARIVTWQETQPLTFQVKAVEEVEYISTSTLAADSVTEATDNSLFTRPQPLADFGMYELPAEFQGADAQLYVGYRQQTQVMGARLYLSTDGVTYGLADEVQPFIISGITTDDLPVRPPGYVEENIEIYLMPDQLSSGSFNPSSPLYAQNFTLDDVSPQARAAGIGNVWINSEMVAIEGVNLLGQNYYRIDKVYRGWGGTHIQAHNSGDTWWKHGGGVFFEPINEDKIGTLLYYKVTGFNFAGQEYSISSVAPKTYQIQGTYWRPQAQAPLATYVQSPGSYLTIQSEDLGSIQRKKVVTGGSPVQFEWEQSAQEAGWGAQGYGVGGYGRFVQDTASVSYRIEVLSADYSTVVRCTTVNTTAFLYTTALNSEDWNGWQGSFAVRVTPFNTYGAALRSRTKILELFE